MTDQDLIELAADRAVSAINMPGDFLCGYYTGLATGFSVRIADDSLRATAMKALECLLSANHLYAECERDKIEVRQAMALLRGVDIQDVAF